ncbi:MAG: aminodeoxychorismate synthase component I [Flavobacteriaceae bacterium]|nr:aminodeoxychorismate synthase component I [Flavobacteriaceae bacterium]
MIQNQKDCIIQMNLFGKKKIPFLFVLDFEFTFGYVIPLAEIDQNQCLYFVPGSSNAPKPDKPLVFNLKPSPISFETYLLAFQKVQDELQKGNSFLTNLTFETPLECDAGLRDIFLHSHAKYKLWMRDQFVVFSPETFVSIDKNVIYTHPMKGTIDARLPDAENLIRNSEKEKAEHYTIVDLLRNDLSKVAKKVEVSRLRYLEKISAKDKELLQVSSEIRGILPADWHSNIGDIFAKLLPAGSVTGAPKPQTVQIIKSVENHRRNFYTGVFGIFDGEKLDSAVMIRFINQKDNGLFYKSGGGITHLSDAKNEYEEMIQKIYVPIS